MQASLAEIGRSVPVVRDMQQQKAVTKAQEKEGRKGGEEAKSANGLFQAL